MNLEKEILSISNNINKFKKGTKTKSYKSSIERLAETYDDLEEEKKKLEEEMEELDELDYSNQFKTRIIDSEINSNINLQIFIYFNFWYFFIAFAIEISAICFKIYIYNHDPFRWIKFALELVWAIIEPIKVYNGYYGNINENVNNHI